MCKFLVTGLFSEIHNLSTFAVSKLRNIFRSSLCKESEDILRCSMKRLGVCLCWFYWVYQYCSNHSLLHFRYHRKYYLVKTFHHLSDFLRRCFNGTNFMEYRIFCMKKFFRSLSDIFEKSSSFLQKEQYHVKGSFFSFSYFFLLTFTQFTWFHLSHRSHWIDSS